MKFVISRDDLLKAISCVQNTVSQKPIIPVLSNVLIEATTGIVITATDLTVSMQYFIPAKIFNSGSTTLPAKKFFQLIREITSQQIEISCTENHITEISADRSDFKLNGMEKESFPSMPAFDLSQNIVISQGQLKELLFRTSFTASREDSRMCLSGLLVQLKDGHLIVVGTDGKRLAMSTLNGVIDSSLHGNFIVPIKAIEDIYRVLKDNDESLTIHFLHDKICLETSDFKIVTKLLSGDFPNFEQVIPKEIKYNILVDKDEFYSKLRQVSLFTSENNLAVKFTFSDSMVAISTNNPEVGQCCVSMNVHYHGPQIEISFNPIFILDILKHCFEKQIWICLNDTFTPGIVRDNQDSLYVLMPMRTESA